MPFDGRFLDTDPAPLDADGEIILSPELQELASQLTSEADTLAKEYPFDHGTAPRKKRWLGVITGAVGVVLAITACFAIIALNRQPPVQPLGPINPNIHNSALNANTLRPATGPAAAAGDSPLQITPAIAIPDVSSPELEGILDVLEDSPEHTCSISI